MSGTRKSKGPRAWSPAKATEEIRSRVTKQMSLSYTRHARERMGERGLIVADILYALKNGFVYEEAEPAETIGYFKYKIESKTPNSGRRTVRLVVVPGTQKQEIKVVTIMWVDES